MTPTKEQTYILLEDVEKIILGCYMATDMITQINLLPTHKLPQTNAWISVSERLPEESGVYIVFDEGEVSQGWYDGRVEIWYYEDYKIEPTHWMNLPEPPAKMSPLPPKQ